MRFRPTGTTHGFFVPQLLADRDGPRTHSLAGEVRRAAVSARGSLDLAGHTIVAGKRIDFGLYDVWNHPSYATYSHINDSNELQVRFSYSNIPLLQHMEIYVPDFEPPSIAAC